MYKLLPSRTVITSFHPKSSLESGPQSAQDYFELGNWVLCVSTTKSWIGCAISDGQIQIYDSRTMQLCQSYFCSSLVTDTTIDHVNQNILGTSALDGHVTLFDIREKKSVFDWKLERNEEEALSMSIGYEGKVIAVGSNRGRVHFVDIRSGRRLGTYENGHQQAVTKCIFQQTPSTSATTSVTTPTLISTSEDGLICVYDTTKPSEELALENIINVQSPVREAGFFGPQSEAIYCLTGDESLKLYSARDSICRRDSGQQLRNILSQQVEANVGAACRVDYLVDCIWDSTSNQLLLLAGSASGDASVFQVGEIDISPVYHLGGGHQGVVRAWGRLSSSTFLTAGEDARLCEWNIQVTTQPAPALNSRITYANNGNDNRKVMPARGGKIRRPRSRMTNLPY